MLAALLVLNNYNPYVVCLIQHLCCVRGCIYKTVGNRADTNQTCSSLPLWAGLQIRRSNRDNLGIIFNISSVKHIL